MTRGGAVIGGGAALARPGGPQDAGFLIVTPSTFAAPGRRSAGALWRALEGAGVVVARRSRIEHWARVATVLYGRGRGRDDADGRLRAARFERRWRALFPRDTAEVWDLADPDSFARLWGEKRALRRTFAGVPLVDDARGFSLHAFHVPDVGDVVVERATLRGATGRARSLR